MIKVEKAKTIPVAAELLPILIYFVFSPEQKIIMGTNDLNSNQIIVFQPKPIDYLH